MEPEGSGKRSADQLQGAAVQDQAVRSVSPTPIAIMKAIMRSRSVLQGGYPL